MSRLLGLAINTFREAVRDRVLYSILFFGVGVIFLSLALEELTIGDQAKVVRSVGQGAIDSFGSLIAMFLGVSLVWKELDKKTIYTILSKPIPRWMFVIGKYLGLLLTLLVEVTILMVIYRADGDRADLPAHGGVCVDGNADAGADDAHGVGDPVFVLLRADDGLCVHDRHLLHRPPRGRLPDVRKPERLRDDPSGCRHHLLDAAELRGLQHP
jgi:hypothetical protein